MLLTEPIPSTKDSNTRIFIPVSTNSLVFRNLAVYLYCKKTGSTASNIKVELREEGMGIPGLIIDSMVPMLGVLGDQIVFDLDFTMELRIGSMEKGGLSIPLPTEAHQCNIHGSYNLRTKAHSAEFKVH